ncbi:MAG: 16S rRNA (guanine(527)-N(7))-methyltransferase RsmG [Spirochaetaceae bacterium]|jgi:16S rRNA (guanine527-N7)-methyltransferase|nr:16S rRNA (guanine(527)-N(7))-methyltransferase RsmG [Spirochaetaceae bacterium]
MAAPRLKEGLAGLAAEDAGVERLFHRREENVCALLERFIGEIELFNAAYGLVSYSGPDELVTRHVLDSLAPLGIICRECAARFPALAVWEGGGGLSIADFGSGAGFPGIPLAIALPKARFTLIERKKKRSNFLQSVCAGLGLSNAVVAEDAAGAVLAGAFHAVTFRAVSPLNEALEKELGRLLGENGFIAAYKGRAETARAETRGAKGVYTARSCKVPFLDGERTMLISQALRR